MFLHGKTQDCKDFSSFHTDLYVETISTKLTEFVMELENSEVHLEEKICKMS